jgi:hypothetical protein
MTLRLLVKLTLRRLTRRWGLSMRLFIHAANVTLVPLLLRLLLLEVCKPLL